MREFIAVLMVAFALLGCKAGSSPEISAAASAPTTAKPGKTVSAELTGYNHTDKTIGAFYVNGQWGGNITPGSGGGSFVCCVALPRPWHEGYMVTVTWEDHELKMQKREVSVPQYDASNIGSMNVHFLRSGEIKVFAGMIMLGHPDYPLKGAEARMPPGTLARRAASGAENKLSGHSPLVELIEFLRDVIPMELRQVPEPTLTLFVSKYQKAAISAGLDDLDRQSQYLLLALYTSGKGVEHPAFMAFMQSPSTISGSFSDGIQKLPKEVWSAGPPLWDSVKQVRPRTAKN